MELNEQQKARIVEIVMGYEDVFTLWDCDPDWPTDLWYELATFFSACEKENA